MSRIHATTNFRDSNGVDLGKKLITKDYLISVYPEIGQQIGIPPELWVWGTGSYGQLGNNATTNVSTPVTTFTGGSSWKQVSAGSFYTSAIKTDGTLWIALSIPTTLAAGNDWKQVSTQAFNVAAIKTDGTLWTWGNGAYGQLGNNDTTDVTETPITTFAGGTNWKQVSSVGSVTAAIKTDGTLWTWGNGYFGSLGTNDTISVSTPVTTFAGGNNWKQVSAGTALAAIKTDGTLWTWGDGIYGKLGNAVTTNTSTPVTTFAGGTNWKQVSAGGLHTAAIKTDGTLWTWGNATFGSLGINLGFPFYEASTSTPVTTFAGGTNWKQVSAGAYHTTAIKTDGTLWTWGADFYGSLGVGAALSPYGIAIKLTPVTTFAGGTNWKQVSCGFYHTAAIKSVDFASF
jgi:alpha-tubulin suppressor-like RCC1 family protein